MPLRFQKQLMTVLIAEFDDLIFNGRAITRSNTPYLSRIQWRFMQVVTYCVMDLAGRVSYIATDLILLYSLSRKRERYRPFIRWLRLKEIPIYSACIQP